MKHTKCTPQTKLFLQAFSIGVIWTKIKKEKEHFPVTTKSSNYQTNSCFMETFKIILVILMACTILGSFWFDSNLKSFVNYHVPNKNLI